MIGLFTDRFHLSALSEDQISKLETTVNISEMNHAREELQARIDAIPRQYFDNLTGDRYPLRNYGEIIESYQKRVAETLRKKAIEAELLRQQARARRLICLFVIAAKMSKADGRVDASEVRVAERLFAKFNIQQSERHTYVKAFNEAINNPEGVYSYAQKVASDFPIETRLFLYELLWDIACADGIIVSAELKMLKDVCIYLRLSTEQYTRHYNTRSQFCRQENSHTNSHQKSYSDGYDKHKDRSYRNNTGVPPTSNNIEAAYLLIGCSASMTNEQLKSAYHLAAKQYHPDILRGKGIPEDLIQIANEKMVMMNNAWALICKTRGI